MSELLRPPVLSPGLLNTPLVDPRTGLITREWAQYFMQLRGAVASLWHGPLPPYTIANLAIDRALDANATTTKELADLIGTLILDLQSVAGF